MELSRCFISSLLTRLHVECIDEWKGLEEKEEEEEGKQGKATERAFHDQERAKVIVVVEVVLLTLKGRFLCAISIESLPGWAMRSSKVIRR